MKFRCRYGQDAPQQGVRSAQHSVPQVRVEQLAWHVPPEQACPDEQAFAHVPQ